jgi:hypothetical protein
MNLTLQQVGSHGESWDSPPKGPLQNSHVARPLLGRLSSLSRFLPLLLHQHGARQGQTHEAVVAAVSWHAARDNRCMDPSHLARLVYMVANKKVYKPAVGPIKKSYLEKFSKAGQLDEANLGPMGFEEEGDDQLVSTTDSEAGPSQACASPVSHHHQGLLRATPRLDRFSHVLHPRCARGSTSAATS